MSGKHILAFEPDPLYAKMIQDEFGARGYNVEIVTDGAVGLERAYASPPDLIYLCIELPRISGFSVCNKLRKNEEIERVPLIIASAEATEEVFEKHRKLKAHADEYLLKPFGADALVPLVQKLLGGVPTPPVPGAIPSGELYDDGGDDEVEEIEEVESFDEPQVSVEKEIAALTDAAFDAISMDEPQRASQPPAPRHEDSPTRIVDSGELQRLAADNEALREKVAGLEKQVAEVKPAKGGGVSSREFLDLRELLNKKDRELLDLKDSVNSKEKVLLESRQTFIELERANADLEDKNIKAEKQIAELQGRVEDLVADKGVAHKRAEDLQARVETLQTRVEGLDNDLDKEKAARRADAERLEAEKIDAVMRAVAEKDLEKSAALSELRASLDKAQAQALADQKAELEADADMRRESDLAEQRLRHEAATEELRASLAAEKADAIADLHRVHDAKLAAMDDKHRVELGELKGHLYDSEQKARSLTADLEETTTSLNESREELAATMQLLTERTEEAESLRSKLYETEGKLETATRELEEMRRRFSLAEAKIEKLNGDLVERDGSISSLSEELVEMGQTLAENESVVAKARQSLDTAVALLAEISAKDNT